MFTNEEFDLDEDFLNDISQKESQYYSQGLSSDEERPAKRFKSKEDCPQQFNSKSATPLEKKNSLVQNTKDIKGKQIIRKNLILDRLKRNEITTSNPRLYQSANQSDSRTLNLGESSTARESFPHPTNKEFRKTLILEKLKKSSIEKISTCSPCPAEKSSLTNLNAGTSKSRIDHGKAIGNWPLKLGATHNKPVALVRQFPGPAGLLPQSTSGVNRTIIGESMCFDKSNDGTEIGGITDHSMISEYCSQNTKNSFSEGAWQLLMSDLSPDFLNGHDISSVKQKVWSNSHRNNKVPFLAGMVQRVDLTSLNPLVVLKDCTGTIEGTICKDILDEYPHVLDIGVVLFLAEVGLLTIGSYLKKCHIIITIKNIINVYTARSRTFSIAEMDTRLKNLIKTSQPVKFDVNQLFNSESSSNSKFQRGPNMEQVLVTKDMNQQLGLNNFKNDSNLDSSLNFTCKPMAANKRSVIMNKLIGSEESQNSTYKCADLFENNSENLNNFRADTNLVQSTDHIDDKPTSDPGDFQDLDDDFAASFFDIDDNLVPETTRNLVPTTNSQTGTHIVAPLNKNTMVSKESSALGVTHSNVNLPQETERCISEVTNVWSRRTEKTEDISRKAMVTSECGNSDIKLKLSVLRSNTVLTPESCEDLDNAPKQKSHEQNQNSIGSSFRSALLLDEENDADEELLSQLDVESTVCNYNTLNDSNI